MMTQFLGEQICFYVTQPSLLFFFLLFWAIYSMLLSLISPSLSIWHISVTGYITNDSYREMLTGNRLSAFHVLKSKVHFKTVQTV